MTDFQTLAKTTYMSIESYRRDGTRVRTPVWLTTHAGKLHCWTQAKSGKVKRIRNNPSVRLAICDARGHVKGDWVEATGIVLAGSDATEAQARQMRAKYGLRFLAFQVLPRLRGSQPIVIEFAPA